MTTQTRTTILCVVLLLSLPLWAQGQGNGRGNSNGQGDPAQVCPSEVQCPANAAGQTCPGQGRRMRGRHGGFGRGRQGGCPVPGSTADLVPLTEAEIPLVLMMREEEKLARDVYLTLGQQFDVPVFTNIAASEQRHMNAIGWIIETHELTDPVTDSNVGVFTDPNFSELFTTLTEEGRENIVAATQVGAYIEEIDIQDLNDALEVTTHPQLTRVFSNLLWGSHNHLRAFTRLLKAQGVTYVPQVLSPEVYQSIVDPTPAENPQGSGGQQRRGQGKN